MHRGQAGISGSDCIAELEKPLRSIKRLLGRENVIPCGELLKLEAILRR